MEELLNTIYDNAVSDMENAFVKMVGKQKVSINTDKRMKSVFGEIKLVELVPTNESVNVIYLDENENVHEEIITNFSLTDMIGIGEYVDDFGKLK